MNHSSKARIGSVRRVIGLLRPLGRGAGTWTPELLQGHYVALTDGRHIFVRFSASASSSPTPVLFLHGITLSGDVNFAECMRRLKHQCTVLSVDLPGHGFSDPRTDRFDIEDLADDVAEVLNALDLPHVIVVGYSLGGLVALQLALRHPKRVAGIVPAAVALNYRETRRDRVLLNLFWMLDRLPWLPRRGPHAGRFFGANRTGGDPFNDRWPWTRQELARTTASGAIRGMAAVGRYDLRELARNLAGLPSAYLFTIQDTVCRPAGQQRLVDALDPIVIRIDADHDVPVVRPEIFADAVQRAVDRVQEEILSRQPGYFKV